MKKALVVVAAVIFTITFCATTYADSRSVLKQGLLGAGTGAVATAMSGAKGDDIWKGALAGAGVNVVGGALFDILTGEQVGTFSGVQRVAPVRQVVEPVRIIPVQAAPQESMFSRAYREGFEAGYRQGYDQGYRDAFAYLSRQ